MLRQRNKLLAVLALDFSAITPAQNSSVNSNAPAESGKPVANTLNKAGDIASQPVRDVGINKREIPEVLQRSADDPYATNTVRTCSQISSAMRELNDVLGPDYEPGRTTRENRVGRLAEAGGKTVVNAFIPFRGLVREVSGAAPAERRYNAALDAGLVRRGFLRGLAVAKGCKLKATTIKGGHLRAGIAHLSRPQLSMKWRTSVRNLLARLDGLAPRFRRLVPDIDGRGVGRGWV